MNYQVLAMEIVMAAMEDARGEDIEAQEAQEWLERIDISGIGIDNLNFSDLETCLSMNDLNDMNTLW
jgi:hypothetical protein